MNIHIILILIPRLPHHVTMIRRSVNIGLSILPESQISALKIGCVRFLPRSMTVGF